MTPVIDVVTGLDPFHLLVVLHLEIVELLLKLCR
jgi:hypothetical protein